MNETGECERGLLGDEAIARVAAGATANATATAPPHEAEAPPLALFVGFHLPHMPWLARASLYARRDEVASQLSPDRDD